MVNEIKGPNNTLINGLANQQQAEQTANRAKASSSDTARDNVSLTDQAEKLRTLEASLDKQPVVDTKRVESIKQALLDGTYSVDSNKTAEKMAEFELLLDSKVGSEK